MIYTTPGSTFVASTDPMTSGLVGTIGVQITQGATVVLTRTTAGIVENPPSSGIYAKADLVAPATEGNYVIAWDDGSGEWASESLSVRVSESGLAVPNGMDLCTVADVKLMMQKAGANASTQDALIQRFVTRASVKIMRDYSREFIPGGPNGEDSINATRTFEFDSSIAGEVFVDLSPYDLQTDTVPTVVIDPDLSSAITITSDQFRLFPVPASKGIYEAIRLSLLSARGGYPRFNHRQMSVTGNWGFPSVPYEVTQACAATVVHWITSFPAARRPDDVDSSAIPTTPRSYPMSALDDLKAFCRPVV